ncbi:pentapeptide repeat-containing protein [Amycolatopsis plumensis]|uniref:Pentapeptide repeat-containing protein n=1 Tax=Amycolatopsis plumensis TaxID=236508 RepID=A0ABV5U3Q5_9PSEU
MITAFTAIGALVFTGLSLNATRDQVEVAQQGQYTDRYTKAVEQLDQTGPEHLQTRLGGIYALQRLAIDSPRDQPTIINVLVTFIISTIHRVVDPPSCAEPTAPDTQAALTVLIERDRKLDAGTTPDHGMRLPGACLSSGQLRHAYLSGADLDGADLLDTDLGAAVLNAALLDDANLLGANLRGTDLRGRNWAMRTWAWRHWAGRIYAKQT